MGVGPLFATLNTANYTPYNVCTTSSNGSGGGAVGGELVMRRRRFAPYGDDFSWRTQRIPPPGYSVSNSDNALQARMEVDGSAFVIGNVTATCGAYIGCEALSPVGNFTILYTYNTSGMVYFQVYPAIEALRGGLSNLSIVINGLNGSTGLDQNVTYLTQQVNLLWLAVDNLTAIVDNQTAVLANFTATLIQLINETDTLSNYVYNVLGVEIADLETNLTLVSNTANAALACCNSTNTTIAALVANISALQADMANVTAEIAVLQGNITTLQSEVLTLQTNATTIQVEIVILQTNVSVIDGELSVLETNVTSLTNITTVLQAQVDNLTACCNSSTPLTTVGPVTPAATDSVTINGTTIYLAFGDAFTQGVTYGWMDDGTNGTYNTFLGYATPSSAVVGQYNTGLGTLFPPLQSLTSGNGNTAAGLVVMQQLTTGDYNVGLGSTSGANLITGSSNIYVGFQTVAGGNNSATNEYIFGSWYSSGTLTGHGSDSYTLDFVAVPTASNPTLQISATGQITRTASSMVYKNPLPDPPMAQFAHFLDQLVTRAFTFKSDPTNRTRLGYYAEEVEAIVGPLGNPVFDPLLNYRMVDDTSQPAQPTLVWVIDPVTHLPVQQMQDVYPKKRVVDSLNYQGFVVPLVAYAKWLGVRYTLLEQAAGLTTPAMA